LRKAIVEGRVGYSMINEGSTHRNYSTCKLNASTEITRISMPLDGLKPKISLFEILKAVLAGCVVTATGINQTC
jgi:hypothetical protein